MFELSSGIRRTPGVRAIFRPLRCVEGGCAGLRLGIGFFVGIVFQPRVDGYARGSKSSKCRIAADHQVAPEF